jgi:hypothetical protein
MQLAVVFDWLYIVVYGPASSSQRSVFLNEIRSISLIGIPYWLVGGDFNLIRIRQ